MRKIKLTEEQKAVFYLAASKTGIIKQDSLQIREQKLRKALISHKINESKIIDAGEVPAKGANLSVIFMADRVRINYRCGYSRHNYAPCLEIML